MAEQHWRIIVKPDADAADLLAIPAAVAEGRVAGRYIMAARPVPDTLIITRVKNKGILVGHEVSVDRDEAAKRGIDIAVQPRAGRGSIRPAGTISLQEMMLKSGESFETAACDENEPAVLLYTSGTTGTPKGVMLTERNFRSECEATESVVKTDTADRFASLVPFFHVFGLADGCILPIHRGCSSVLVAQYAPRRFLDLADETGMTVMLAIPSQYLHLLIAARRRGKSPHIKYCISGAAPLPLKIIEGFKEVFGATIIEGYGMTETTSAVAVNPPERIKEGSIGLPLPGIEMKVVDDNGNEPAAGSAGEILIKGPMITPGYYNLPEATAETFDNGWLRTGDIGYKDEDGYFFITDRLKDIIIKGGYNISPREIEEMLIRHPKVREAAVVGKRNVDKESIKAFVVLTEGESASPEEILKYCRDALASYKTPDELEFIQVLPKSATGKLLRRELSDGYKDPRLIERGDK